MLVLTRALELISILVSVPVLPGCRQIKTTAYSKEENAIVEWSNKE